MIVLNKHVNDIHNIFLRDDTGAMKNFTRAGEDEFYLSYSHRIRPGSVCQNCGDFIFNKNDEENHMNCKVQKFTSIEMAQYVAEYLSNYPSTIICINNGYEDQCYLKQKTYDK